MGTDHHTEHNNVDHISPPTEDEDQILANSIMAKLPTKSPFSPRCCIFRVPEVLRGSNHLNAFEPNIVAIGPFHRKKRSLQPMERVKKWYLHALLSRVNLSVLHLIKCIKEFETQARESYEAPVDVADEKNEFLEMMVIDGCFLIEIFRKAQFPNLISSDDPIFIRGCMSLYHDLLLLENQVPWFILEKLCNATEPNDAVPLLVLVLNFFGCYYSPVEVLKSRLHLSRCEILHIVHLIREVLVYSYLHTDMGDSSHLVYKPKIIPCVTRLLDSGVKFKKSSSRIMLNVTFQNGIFEIPMLSFDEETEPLFRNIIAFEQCRSNCKCIITSYAVLMDNLINTSEDVEHLHDVGVMENWLSAEDAARFFNGLYTNTVSDFCYDKLCENVNKYYESKWHRWRSSLLRDYFKNPWSIISLLAAFALLVLTFLQTFYTMRQSHPS